MMPPKSPSKSKSGKKPRRGNPGPPKKTGKGRKRPIDWRLHLLLLGSAALIVGLVLLARHEERQPPLTPSAPPALTEVDPAAVAREQMESFLALAGIPAKAISREPADLPRHYQVRHRFPPASTIEKLRQSLRRNSPPLSLSAPEDGVLVVTDGLNTLLTVQFLPPPPQPSMVTPPSAKHVKVAIIVDDLGRGTNNAKQLLDLRQQVTLAILPGEPHAAQVAEMAYAAGREVILHTPMEPQGFPVIDPGDDALLVGQSDADLRAHLKKLLHRVPHVAGANNHMGSRFTEDPRAMAAVMAVLHEQGLFFVDSLTTSHSVGGDSAQTAGVPVIRRDIFLDNVAESKAIAQQLRRLVEKARRNGAAVGICHPYPETLLTLRRELPKLAAQGIEFVPISSLVVKNGGRL